MLERCFYSQKDIKALFHLYKEGMNSTVLYRDLSVAFLLPILVFPTDLRWRKSVFPRGGILRLVTSQHLLSSLSFFPQMADLAFPSPGVWAGGG
jgi:hypothetical protein